jgi:uncharacterized protein (TIGR02646 family)
MKQIEDFVIDHPYEMTMDDISVIDEASPDVKDKDHWEKDCLKDFKRRFRAKMLPKQNYRCAYCRLELHPNEATPEIEHIVPKSLKPNWMYEPFNLCLSCKLCNTKKGHVKKTLEDESLEEMPRDSESYKMIHPHLDKYSDNIEFVGDILYKGISKKGRYTIWLCELNRYEVAAARAMELIKQGAIDETRTIFLLTDSNNQTLVDDLYAFLDDIKNRIRIFKQINGEV